MDSMSDFFIILCNLVNIFVIFYMFEVLCVVAGQEGGMRQNIETFMVLKEKLLMFLFLSVK